MIDCVLLVVSYRSVPDVLRLLETVPAAVGDLFWHTVIVNNEPSDDLTEVVAAHPRTQLVEAGSNVGYAGGLNRGLDAAPPSRWTVFLNPDVRLSAESIVHLTTASGQRDAAVPYIVDEGGRQCSLRREPTVLGTIGDGLFGDRWPDRPALLSETVREPAAYEHPGDVDWATGAVLVVPTALTKQVGRWDSETFFLYSEETDYCRRLRMLGASIRFVPNAVVHHRGGGSGTSDALHALQEVNRVRYFRKWHGRVTAACFAGVVLLNNALRAHRRPGRTALGALVSPRLRTALPGGSR